MPLTKAQRAAIKAYAATRAHAELLARCPKCGGVMHPKLDRVCLKCARKEKNDVS